MEDLLPGSLLLEVLSWLDDESDLARCRLVSKRLRETVRHLRSVKLVCTYGRFLKTRRARGTVGAGVEAMRGTPFKTIITRTLLDRQRVECVTLEMDDAVQRQPNQDQEATMTDLWLSEPSFLREWVPHVAASLRRLSVTDFGQQAQGLSTPILPILSSACKELRQLELGNLSLLGACCDTVCMTQLTSLTLECVGLGDDDLAAIMRNVPSLERLSLISVFGLKELTVEGSCLLSCCFILTSTTPQHVTVWAPKLAELRLCLCPGPERLIIQAPMLASLEVFTEKRPGAVFAVAHTCFLKTLLLISPDLTCVTDFRGGSFISNMVFEAPILAFNESGAWEGILIQPRVRLPDFGQLSVGFPCLDTLFLGPGLWYAMESDADVKKQLGSGWPTLRKLVLHVLLINYNSSLHLLEMIVKSLPSLQALEMYFHSESNSNAKIQLISNMEERFNHVHFKSGTWKDLVWADHIKSSTPVL